MADQVAREGVASHPANAAKSVAPRTARPNRDAQEKWRTPMLPDIEHVLRAQN